MFSLLLVHGDLHLVRCKWVMYSSVFMSSKNKKAPVLVFQLRVSFNGADHTDLVFYEQWTCTCIMKDGIDWFHYCRQFPVCGLSFKFRACILFVYFLCLNYRYLNNLFQITLILIVTCIGTHNWFTKKSVRSKKVQSRGKLKIVYFTYECSRSNSTSSKSCASSILFTRAPEQRMRFSEIVERRTIK